MRKILRRMLIGALTLLLLTTSCNLPAATTPPPIGTILPDENIASTMTAPTTTAGSPTPAVSIPVTGMQGVSLDCQFCVNNEPHAVLVMPELASFNVNVSDPSTRVTCLTAQVVNGRRVVLCRGAQQTSFHLNICLDSANCLQFPIALETCPLDPQDSMGSPLLMPFVPSTPLAQAPINTPIPPTTAPVEPATPFPTQPIPPTTAPAGSATPFPTQPIQPTLVVVDPTHLQPTRPTRATATALPATQQPSSGREDPAGFARWYFGAVWQERNYQDLWDNYLTQSFKTNVGSGSYEDYVTWWGSVERVEVHSVDVMRQEDTYAWVRVNVTFHMKDGRVINNQQYDYDLLYDASRGTWMFDYRV